MMRKKTPGRRAFSPPWLHRQWAALYRRRSALFRRLEAAATRMEAAGDGERALQWREVAKEAGLSFSEVVEVKQAMSATS
jgi:hypothetical protein